MKKIFDILLMLVMFFTAFYTPCFAAVESSVILTLDLENPPLDVAVSPDGEKLYILTDNGDILIYSAKGKLSDTVKVDNDIDGIRVSRSGDVLFLSSQKRKQVQVVLLDFIQVIDVAGSPYKGPDNAPVVITVFSDFQ
jgi:DNA-binding beta-propeller fold protein YncE